MAAGDKKTAVRVCNCRACGEELLGVQFAHVPRHRLPKRFKDHRIARRVESVPFCPGCAVDPRVMIAALARTGTAAAS
jgi:hypothetical protein